MARREVTLVLTDVDNDEDYAEMAKRGVDASSNLKASRFRQARRQDQSVGPERLVAGVR
jgi:hypothetical protein